MLTGTKVTPSESVPNPDALLARELGVRQLAANIFNYTVGSGIFALPATAVLRLGEAAPLSYLVCALIMVLVVLCFAEAGSRVSATGGAYAYVEAALGPFVGFIAGALVFVTGVSSAAAVAALLVGSLGALVPVISSATLIPVLIIAIVTLLVLINVRGVKTSARVLEGITIAKLLPLVAFVLIGAAFVAPSNLAIETVPPVSSILTTAGYVIFAFAGIEGATIPSGEVRNPARTVPRAVFLALASTTVLYLAIHFVAQGIMGLNLAQDLVTPLATTAGTVVGPSGRTVMLVAAVVSTFGYLTANVLSEPRGLFALGRDGFLPRVLVRVHPAFRTPSTAIIIYGVMVVAIALSGTFLQLLVFANLAVLVLYTLCAIAALMLRWRDVRTDGEPFLIPGGPVVPIAACAVLAWLFYQTALDNLQQLTALAVVLGVVIVLYVIRMLRLRGSV